MTHKNLTTEPVASPVAVTRWLRSEPHPDGTKCVCCPEQPGHVFAYAMDLVDPENSPWRSRSLANEPTDTLDVTGFIHDAIARMPEGTQFRIVIEPIRDVRAAEQEFAAMLDANYCPECQHPWSYHREDGCHMPVTPGTNLPVTRSDARREPCGCTHKTYNGYLPPEPTP